MTNNSPESQIVSARAITGRIVRIVRRATGRLASPAWLFRAAAVGLCLASLGFAGALLTAVANGGEIAFITMPPTMRLALFIPYVILVFTAATVFGAVIGWWQRYWSIWTRIHQTALALLGIAFVWQLSVLGFLRW